MTNTSLNLYIGKVNGCSKDIGLRNFFRNFFMKNKKFRQLNFLFFMKVVLKLSENGPLTNFLGVSINRTLIIFN